MANDGGQGAPPDGGGSADDDAWFDGFMDRIDQMEQKLAKIPEDIGEKLDTIMGQTSGNASTATPQPTRPPRPATSQARSVPSTPAPVSQSPASSDTKPRVRHWYFGERPGKRNG